MHKPVCPIDPIFIIVWGFGVIVGLLGSPRKAVGAVRGARDMYEGEIEKKDAGYPTVNGSVQLNIRIIEHPFDVLGINFYD
jgi:hypothetical protein